MGGAAVEQMYLDVLRDVKKSVTIPVAMKLSPYFSATANMAQRLAEAGANALVLFNRFYQPDLDVETLEVVPELTLSTSADLRLPLRWIAILYGRLRADLALTSGVHTAVDVVKSLMAGASVVMMASELLANGVKRIGELSGELADWMETYEYRSVMQMRGSMSQQAVSEPGVYERAQYMKALNSFDHRLP
jgi:dihydroorotate dehydrogenase (fumarate)